MSQWYKHRLLQLDADGNVLRTIEIGAEISGHVFADDHLYVLRGTEQDGERWHLARLDLRETTPRVDELARVPFACRSLTFDRQPLLDEPPGRERNRCVFPAGPLTLRNAPPGIDRRTFDPGVADQGRAGERRHAGRVAVDHADNHLDGGFSDHIVVLIHPSPVRVVRPPFQLHQANILRHAAAKVGQPFPDHMIKCQDEIGFLLLEPFLEESRFPAGFVDQIKRAGALGGTQLPLADVDAGAETAVHQMIDDVIQHQGRTLVSHLQGLLHGLDGQRVLVGGGEGQRGALRADTRDDAGITIPESRKARGQPILVEATRR